MKSKRIAGAIAGLFLLWGTAYAEQPPAASPGDAPNATGATGPGVLIFELQGSQPGVQPSVEEIAVMQMLLLQLLMMQPEPGNGEIQIIAPMSGPGVGI
jgi:hypothetical protein